MRNLRLDKYNVTSLNKTEIKNVDGGVIGIVIGIVCMGFALAYSDGRRDKEYEE